MVVSMLGGFLYSYAKLQVSLTWSCVYVRQRIESLRFVFYFYFSKTSPEVFFCGIIFLKKRQEITLAKVGFDRKLR